MSSWKQGETWCYEFAASFTLCVKEDKLQWKRGAYIRSSKTKGHGSIHFLEYRERLSVNLSYTKEIGN
jgi:hypothetical protein